MNKIFKLISGFSLSLLVFVGCNNPEEPELSVVQNFATYTPTTPGFNPPTVDEFDQDTITILVQFDDPSAQILDETIIVSPGVSSTATLHEDFEILTPSFDLLALGSSEGFEVEIAVLLNGGQEEVEEVYLEISSEAISDGMETVEFLAATINPCVSPGINAFSGSYRVEATNSGFGLPLIETDTLNVIALDAFSREVIVNAYPFFGGFPEEFFFNWNGGCGEGDAFEFVGYETGLSCNSGVDFIAFQPAAPFFDGDPNDDSSFSIFFQEFDPNGCGLDELIELSFTKIEE